jgi:hypothetical protein
MGFGAKEHDFFRKEKGKSKKGNENTKAFREIQVQHNGNTLIPCTSATSILVTCIFKFSNQIIFKSPRRTCCPSGSFIFLGITRSEFHSNVFHA